MSPETDLKDFPVLETERLVLRLPQAADAPALLAIKLHELIAKDYGAGNWKELADAQRYVEHMQRQYVDKWGLGWGITLKTDPTHLIGTCRYHSPISYNFSAQIDYELYPDYWGHGFATEAVTAMIRFGFCDLLSFPLNRIWALVWPTNTRSIKLLNRLGFHYEGTLRDYDYSDSHFRDYQSFSLLKREWRI